MALRQFEKGEVVTFLTGEVATVARVSDLPYHKKYVWLAFPDVDHLVGV